MKRQRFWLYRRKGVYYPQNAKTGKRESLETRDRREAERLRASRNETANKPALGSSSHFDSGHCPFHACSPGFSRFHVATG